MIASEAINILDTKQFGGNVALKFDIKEAFDALDWQFLLRVLKAFGFDSKFCNWISVILHSAHLSISVNGYAIGYFSCKRGVRQGDPLSTLLFCLAEEVLSRGVSKLVEMGKLQYMATSREYATPTHVLFAYDILVFCKGKRRNLSHLMKLFELYGQVSGQCLSLEKCRFYAGAMSLRRVAEIRSFLGFQVGSLPFSYLGVPLFKWKPKAIHLQPLIDKIKTKVSAWKGALLSIMGRVQLVKSIIHGMLSYSFHIYVWLVSLLKKIDCWIRNFICSGDIYKRKYVTVSWKKLCALTSEGGLGIRSIRSTQLGFTSSTEQWADFLRARFASCSQRQSWYSSLWRDSLGLSCSCARLFYL